MTTILYQCIAWAKNELLLLCTLMTSTYASSLFSRSSITSLSSLSTITGLGSSSARVIEQVGLTAVNRIDGFIVQRRLAHLEAMLARGRPVVQIKDQKLYSDLLELSRCVLCAMLTFTCQMERNRAFCLIMGT
ncbi:hypothetical protein BDP27DRAFT_236396 [Rhodocollybia butyracea]|uniref:Uncharacterized protein n=1 Tax=Rhodocollybia butyracea TaxID=206335 RepID=A0A9P5U2G7_9AGAR|nr:hypothetical protein BDP27DRAFT_236396 [Rhodocollybia butyracea]